MTFRGLRCRFSKMVSASKAVWGMFLPQIGSVVDVYPYRGSGVVVPGLPRDFASGDFARIWNQAENRFIVWACWVPHHATANSELTSGPDPAFWFRLADAPPPSGFIPFTTAGQVYTPILSDRPQGSVANFRSEGRRWLHFKITTTRSGFGGVWMVGDVQGVHRTVFDPYLSSAGNGTFVQEFLGTHFIQPRSIRDDTVGVETYGLWPNVPFGVDITQFSAAGPSLAIYDNPWMTEFEIAAGSISFAFEGFFDSGSAEVGNRRIQTTIEWDTNYTFEQARDEALALLDSVNFSDLKWNQGCTPSYNDDGQIVRQFYRISDGMALRNSQNNNFAKAQIQVCTPFCLQTVKWKGAQDITHHPILETTCAPHMTPPFGITDLPVPDDDGESIIIEKRVYTENPMPATTDAFVSDCVRFAKL